MNSMFKERKREFVFDSREQAMEFKKMLLTRQKSSGGSNYRTKDKPSVRKTRGWKKYSCFITPHAMPDGTEISNLYADNFKVEKHIRSITREDPSGYDYYGSIG